MAVVAVSAAVTMAGGALAQPPQVSGGAATAAGTAPVPAVGTGAGSAAGAPAGPAETRTVTLLTGDRVELTTVAGRGQRATVRPAPGRSGVAFVESETAAGGLSVVPADALALVAGGQLDARLFDVTALVRRGYDDARRAEIPLIVEYAGTARSQASARDEIVAAGARVTRPLASIDGAAVRASKRDASRLWSELTGDGGAASAAPSKLAAGLARVWLDGPVRASLDQSVPQVGAPAAWQAGYTGDGVKVAVLDTGIDATHPDLDDAVLEARELHRDGGPVDYAGHGTHVASIITGDGDASDGRYKGVAPDADLLVGKVLDDGGYGEESWLIAGMEWAAGAGAKVVNMSLGGCATDGTDPLSTALNALADERGVLFVVAAGNHPNNPYCTYDERVSPPRRPTARSRSGAWTSPTGSATSPTSARGWATALSSLS